MGDPEYTHAQMAITAVQRDLALLFDVPKSSAGRTAYRYRTAVSALSNSGTDTYPAHIELNGETVWSTEALTTSHPIMLDIAAKDLKSGLNELKWRFDSNTSGSWAAFDYHQLKMVPPPGGTLILIW